MAGGFEAAYSVADEELDLIVSPTIGDDGGMAGAIEVGEGDAVRMRVGVNVGGGRGSGVKAAVGVAEQDGDSGGLVVGNDEVEVAVGVHVSDADIVGLMSAGEG